MYNTVKPKSFVGLEDGRLNVKVHLLLYLCRVRAKDCYLESHKDSVLNY